MNVLFLGCSSFTGFHFVDKLSKNKNIKIYCTLQKNISSYKNNREIRIRNLKKKKNIILLTKIKFGDEKFIKLLNKLNFKYICFHHAYTKFYNNNKKFNFKKSLNENLKNIKKVFQLISKKSLIIITNTVFQNVKKKNYNPLNNYGLSKSIIYEKYKYFCKTYNIKYKSIFITNPWGVLEEKKLNYKLIMSWINKKETVIEFPHYIRDNIYIDKLSTYYYKMIFSKSNKVEFFPSGYCSTNRVFIDSLGNEFKKYFNLKPKIKYLKNVKTDQPLIRINGNKILRKIKFKENLKQYFKYYKKLSIN